MSGKLDTADAGSATVLMITLCFVLLSGSLVWLSRTVDQSLDDRTNASAIAFQAARAGAQEIDPTSARIGVAIVDSIAARSAPQRIVWPEVQKPKAAKRVASASVASYAVAKASNKARQK